MGTARQSPHLVGHHGETAALLAGTGRLDGRVERQQVGLLGNRANDFEHAADPPAFGVQRLDRMGGLIHLTGQIADLPHGVLHYPIPLARLLIRLTRGDGGLLGVACDFLHRGRHFMHGSGDLLGFHPLGLNAGTGLRGHGGKLVGCRGDLADATADATDQVAQALRHAMHGVLQLPHFVTARAGLGVREVAAGDALRLLNGGAQGADDHPRDHRGSQQANEDRQRTDHAEQQVAAAALLLHGIARVVQRLVRSGDHHLGLLRHRAFQGDSLGAILAEFVECAAIVLQLHQRLVHGGLLIVVQPDLQIAADGNHVGVQLAPALGGRIGTVGHEQIFLGPHVENLLGQARSCLGHRQRVAALEAIPLQAQHAHGVVHVQLDELELFTADLRGILHARAQRHAAFDQLHVAVELSAVLVGGLLDSRQVGTLLRARSGGQAGQLGTESLQRCVQRVGRGLLTCQRVVTLCAARRKNRRIDAGQLLDLLRPTQNLVDRNEAGRRDAKREQQYQTEAADKLFGNRKIGE